MAPRLLLAGLACLAAAGCGGGGGEPAPKTAPTPTVEKRDAEPPDEAGAMVALLEDRAEALAAGDAPRFESTSTGVQRARDRRTARSARRLSIEQIRFVADDVEIAGEAARVRMTMSYRVRGMERPFVTERRVTAHKQVDGWRITADAPRREPLPWEVAAFEATRAPHVVLLHPPSLDPGPLLSGLVNAYREIERDLPRRDLPPSVLVIAARDEAQTERLTGRLARGVVAIANVSVTFEPNPSLQVARVLAQRLIVVVPRWRAGDATERRQTLVHEMTHTAMDPDTSGRTPPWLAEGMAMYVSDDDRSVEALARAAGVAPAIRLARLCKPNSIFRLSGRAQGAAYAASSAAAHAIVARHGNRGLFKLYDAFNDSRIPGRPGARTTDRVMRRTLGMSLGELEAAVAGG